MTYAAVIALQVCSTLLSLAMLVLAIYKRQAPRTLYFSYVALAIFMFNLGYLVEIATRTEATSILGKQLKYVGVPFIAPFVLLFVLDYCGRRTLRRGQVAALLVVPFLHSIIGITWPWNGIYYTSVTYVANATVPHLDTTGSPLYYCFYVYTYVLTAAALVCAIYYHHKSDAVQKRQSAIMIAGTAIPGIGNALNVLGATIFPFDITSTLLSVTCVLLGYSFLKLGLFQIAPIAREKILETMNDAFIMMDQHGKFIDANRAAKKLFPPLAMASVGAPIGQMAGAPWAAQQAESAPGEEGRTFSLKNAAGEVRYYSMSQTVVDLRSKTVCTCIMVYDVTESKKLLDEVSALAERDTLTGLLNRGTFFKRSEGLFAQVAANKGAASVLMMDLDHFKQLNDTYGHLTGDEVLRTVAQTLLARFRATDLFARYGGEEFCAFLPRAGREETLEIAQQLCEMARKINWGDVPVDAPVTVSIGAAVYDPARHQTLDALIREADHALYAAKAAGRNTVRMGGAQ